jgi:hypothetical protein
MFLGVLAELEKDLAELEKENSSEAREREYMPKA